MTGCSPSVHEGNAVGPPTPPQGGHKSADYPPALDNGVLFVILSSHMTELSPDEPNKGGRPTTPRDLDEMTEHPSSGQIVTLSNTSINALIRSIRRMRFQDGLPTVKPRRDDPAECQVIWRLYLLHNQALESGDIKSAASALKVIGDLMSKARTAIGTQLKTVGMMALGAAKHDIDRRRAGLDDRTSPLKAVEAMSDEEMAEWLPEMSADDDDDEDA